MLGRGTTRTTRSAAASAENTPARRSSSRTAGTATAGATAGPTSAGTGKQKSKSAAASPALEKRTRSSQASTAPSSDDVEDQEQQGPRTRLRRPAMAPHTPNAATSSRNAPSVPATTTTREKRKNRDEEEEEEEEEEKDDESARRASPVKKSRGPTRDPSPERDDDSNKEDEKSAASVAAMDLAILDPAYEESFEEFAEQDSAFLAHARAVAASYPERKLQIAKILRFTGTISSNPVLPALHIWGAPSTGKSLIVRALFSGLGSRHAYVDCATCATPRAMFESILDQLSGKGGEGEEKDAFARYSRCDNLAEFVILLGEVLDGEPEKAGLSRFLVFDNAEKLRDMGANLIAALTRLSEISSRNIASIFVTKVPPDNLRPRTGPPDPISLFFPSYPRQGLLSILLKMDVGIRDDQERKLYSRFAELVLDVFSPACGDVDELGYAAYRLWPVYVGPVRNGELQPTEASKLYTRSIHRIRQFSERLYLRDFTTHEDATAQTTTTSTVNTSSFETGYLPRYAKYLVISSFLASYNPTKYDRRLFVKDHMATRKRGGGRKGGHIKETFGKERQQLLGPKVFPLERMVAIFNSVVEEQEVEVTVDLHTEIATLFSLNLLQRTSEDGVEKLEGVRARCNASWELVQKLAKDLGFELGKYLYNFA